MEDFYKTGMLTYMGMKVIVDPFLPEKSPVIELSRKVTVSDEFRAKTNAWYLEMFGEKLNFYFVDNNILANPKNIARLRRALPNFNT